MTDDELAIDEEVAMLRDSARQFAVGELAPGRLRTLRETPQGFDPSTWRSIAQLGWLGIVIPEELGGSGLGMRHLVAVMEELGQRLLPEPVVPCAVFAGTLLAHAAPSQLRNDLVQRLCSGDLVPAVAWQEGFALDAPTRTIARRVEGGWRLDGGKRFVRPGSAANGLIVTAETDAGLGIFWVPRGTPGLQVDLEVATDESTLMRLQLTGVSVTEPQLLARGDHADAVLALALDWATVASAAELLGVMRGALAMTLDYLRTRQQFGRPIGAFQVLQHRAVDLYLLQELSAAAVQEVAQRFDEAQDAGQRAALTSRVKIRTADAAMQITREAIQMHGAIGFTDECDIGLYLKRALSLSGWLGTSAEHRRRLAFSLNEQTVEAA